jgi:hypothetical protein
MGKNIVELSRRMKEMGKEPINGRMVKHIKGIGKTGKLMGMGSLLGPMGNSTRETFFQTKRMGKGFISAQMDLFIMDNSRMIVIMERECYPISVENLPTQANLKMEKSMDMESFKGQMAPFMKVHFQRGLNMGRAFVNIRMGAFKKYSIETG